VKLYAGELAPYNGGALGIIHIRFVLSSLSLSSSFEGALYVLSLVKILRVPMLFSLNNDRKVEIIITPKIAAQGLLFFSALLAS
jgi:hypothetical protein